MVAFAALRERGTQMSSFGGSVGHKVIIEVSCMRYERSVRRHACQIQLASGPKSICEIAMTNCMGAGASF
jgi:hypothetical protein